LPLSYCFSLIRIVVCCLVFTIICYGARPSVVADAIALPVKASLCRDLDGHRVCIVKIKRSAKYHYRYRTVVSIDGETKPLVVYNCRDRTITKKNKYPIPFKSNSPGNLVCSLFDK
jgi:hypothetical protein